ncbi:MAG: hypothetical protein KDD67_17810 [Ignavibacteriae bacterium]|nr:hypothetical protein [Ignavibacteriota bacterium]MCB9214632.1 hypothetical protein [Ignavibacteria bacterium]
MQRVPRLIESGNDSIQTTLSAQGQHSTLSDKEREILQAIAHYHPDFYYTENVLRYGDLSGKAFYSEIIFKRDSTGLYFGIYPRYEVVIDEFTGVVRELNSIGAMVHQTRSFMVVGDNVETMSWQSGSGGAVEFQFYHNGRLQKQQSYKALLSRRRFGK